MAKVIGDNIQKERNHFAHAGSFVSREDIGFAMGGPAGDTLASPRKKGWPGSFVIKTFGNEYKADVVCPGKTDAELKAYMIKYNATAPMPI